MVASICLLSWFAKRVELKQLGAWPECLLFPLQEINGGVLLAPLVTSPEVDYWGLPASKYWLSVLFCLVSCRLTCSLGLLSGGHLQTLTVQPFQVPLFVEQEELFLAGQGVWARLRLAGRWGHFV